MQNEADLVTTLQQRVQELEQQLARSRQAAPAQAPPAPAEQASLDSGLAALATSERNMRLGTWTWSSATNSVAWSDELYRILGYDPAETQPSLEAFYAAVHPDDRKRPREMSNRAMHGGSTASVASRILALDGAYLTVMQASTVRHNGDGSLHSVTGFVLDITSYVTREVAHQARDKQWRALFDSALHGVAIAIGAVPVAVNARWAQILGYDSPDEIMLTTDTLDWVAPAERDAVRVEQQVLAGQVFETRVVCKDGSLRRVECQFGPITWNGEPATQIQISDVNDSRRSLRRFEAAHAHVARIQAMGHIGSWHQHLGTQRLVVSDQLYKNLGLNADDAPPSCETIKRPMPPEDRGTFEAKLAHLKATREPVELDHRIVLPSGEMRWMRSRAEMELDGAGEPLAIHGMMEDISDLKFSEQALRRSNALLERVQALGKIGTWRRSIRDRSLVWSRQSHINLGRDPDGNAPGTFEQFLDLLPPESLAIVMQQNSECLERGQSGPNTWPLITPTGERKMMRSHSFLEYDEHGEPEFVTGSTQDVTDLIVAQEALAERESVLRAYFRSHPNPVLVWRRMGDDLVLEEYSQALRDEWRLPLRLRRGMRASSLEQFHGGLAAKMRQALCQGQPQRQRIILNGESATAELHLLADYSPVEGQEMVLQQLLDITDQVNADIRARYLTQVFDTIAEAVLWHGANGEIVDCNASAERILRIKRADLLGRNPLDPGWTAYREDGSIMPPEERPAVRCLNSGKAISGAIQGLPTEDGKMIWVSVNARPFFDSETHESLGVVTSFSDITEYKRVKDSLLESEERFLRSFEQAAVGILIADLDGTVLESNPRLAEMLGHDAPAQLVGASIGALLVGEDHAVFRERQTQLDSGERSYAEEIVQFVTRSGEPIWASMSVSVISDANLTSRRYLYVQVQNITARKAAQDQADAQRAYLKATMDGIGDSLVTKDESGRIESFNLATTRLLGWTDEDLLGRNVRMLIPEPHAGALDQYIQRYLDTGVPRIIGTAGRELEVCHKDGHLVPVELSITEFWENGRRHFIGIMRDISQRKHTEGLLFRAQKMETVGRLAGGIAHDFNNLLQVIGGYAELATIQSLDDPELQETIVQIEQAVDTASRLTRQLLTFSRQEAAQKRKFSLANLVEDNMEMIRRLVGTDIELVVDLTKKSANIHGHVAMIQQVLMNLCVNAREAMSPGGKLRISLQTDKIDPEPAQRLGLKQGGDVVCLQASDTGVGIDNEFLDKVFEPFFTTRAEKGGTGLGLSIIYGVVEEHEGAIHIDSKVNAGTTFSVYFPRMAADHAKPKPPSIVDFIGGDETILIVEDEDNVRDVLRSFL